MTWQRKRIIILIGLGVLMGLWLKLPFLIQARTWSWQAAARAAPWLKLTEAEEILSEQNRLESLLAENLRLKAELSDYRKLREQISAPTLEGFRAIPAAVVGRPIDTFHAQIVVNKGTRAGVVMGSPAVILSSVLVGFVTDLNSETATVTLLVHPATTVSAEVINEDEQIAQGLVEGVQYTALELTTVPRDVVLAIGQPVVTKGKAPELPYGLIVGTIGSIRSEETDIYQAAHLQIPYDLDDIRAVNLLEPLL
jgi:rod shape-determining protein MreC